MTALSGTATMVRLALRRDRFRLSAYVLGLAILWAGMLAAEAAHPHQALVEETEIFMRTPAVRALRRRVRGQRRVHGADPRLRGACGARRADERAKPSCATRGRTRRRGRSELVGAAVVSRHATLAAAPIVTIGAGIALAAALGLAGIMTAQPAAGSFAAGAAAGAFGTVFAGVAAVTVQLSSTTRGASGLAAAVLGLAFLVSGVGNMLASAAAGGLRLMSAWPAWLSPMGWGQEMRPYGGDHWWPLALSAVAFVALVGAAGTLAVRRDVSRGMLAERRGRAEAASALLSPLGLVWRLQRGAMGRPQPPRRVSRRASRRSPAARG